MDWSGINLRASFAYALCTCLMCVGLNFPLFVGRICQLIDFPQNFCVGHRLFSAMPECWRKLLISSWTRHKSADCVQPPSCNTRWPLHNVGSSAMLPAKWVIFEVPQNLYQLLSMDVTEHSLMDSIEFLVECSAAVWELVVLAGF
jgi:hypothetical protein